jgi:hypothetical protein
LSIGCGPFDYERCPAPDPTRWTGGRWSVSRLPQVNLAVLIVASLTFAQDKVAQQAPGLDDQSFATLRDRIQISDPDLLWEQLPWLTTYHAGLEKAAAEAKPLLLWVMNGHPLGCT